MAFLHLPALSALLLVASCDVGERVSAAAESTRIATERLGEASVARSNLKEQQILADAKLMEAQAAARSGFEVNSEPRYVIRRDGAGWTVYDGATNRAAKVGTKFQTGLSREEAESTFSSLQREEEKSAFR